MLSLDQSSADAPRARREGDPWIELLGIEKQEPRATFPSFPSREPQQLLRLKFAGERPQKFALIMKTSAGRQATEVSGSMASMSPPQFGNVYRSASLRPVNKAEGLFELELPPFGNRAEVWAEYEPDPEWPRTVRDHSNHAGIKISKSLVHGPVGQTTLARAWTAEELQAAEKLRLDSLPAPAPPEGLTSATEAADLKAGTPLVVYRRGEWMPAHLLEINGDKFTVRIEQKTPAWDVQRLDRSRCAVRKPGTEVSSETTLPRVRIYPGTLAMIPDGFDVVPETVRLAPGMPLRTSSSLVHGDTLFMGYADNGEFVVRSISQPSRRIVGARTTFSAREADLKKLQEPDGVEEFAERKKKLLALLDREADLKDESSEIHKQLQGFSIVVDQRVRAGLPPEGFQPIGENQPVPTGLPVLVKHYSAFTLAEVVESSDAGRIEVRLATDSSNSDQRLPRSAVFYRPSDRIVDGEKLRAPDQSAQRNYRFVVQASGNVGYAVNSFLKQTFDISPKGERYEVTVEKTMTPRDACNVEFHLFSKGATVRVAEAEAPSKN